MAKKLENKLEKAVNAIVTRLEKAENFVLEQAPDVCKEVIREKLALGIFNSSLFVVGSVFFGRLSFYLFSCLAESGRDSFGYGMGGALTACAALFCTVGAIVELSGLISVKTAPKLTILRELKSLTEKDDE